MSDTGWAAFIADNHEDESPAQRSSRLARLAAERQDRADQLAEAERAAAIEDERDRRLMTYQQLGIAGRSAADVFADAGRIGDEDAEYSEAQRTIERIEKRRARRAEAMRYEAEQLATATTAQRSADPLEAAQREAHRAFVSATRARMTAAATGAPQPRARRPFAGRAGVAVRSDQPVTCPDCITYGATAEESFLIHHDEDLGAYTPGAVITTDHEQRASGTGRVPMIYR